MSTQQSATAPAPRQSEWRYLTPSPSRFRKQLYVMGTRLPASSVWSSIVVNGYTIEKAAENWDIPVAAVEECVRYCEENEDLISAEAAAERARAIERGHRLEPPPFD